MGNMSDIAGVVQFNSSFWLSKIYGTNQNERHNQNEQIDQNEQSSQNVENGMPQNEQKSRRSDSKMSEPTLSKMYYI